MTVERAYKLDIPRTLEEVFELKRFALLVYDMQVGILRQLSNGSQVTSKVVEVLQAARRAGVRIFFCRHMSLPKELMGVAQLRMAMAWQRVDSVDKVRPWFLRDSPGFALVPEMAPLPSEAIFDKITMSAFEGTPLDIALRDCDVHAIAVVGVALEIGIEPTLRHAADLGYIPILVTDACGAGNEEAARRSVASLEFSGDCLMTDSETLCEHFRKMSHTT
jgi:nicotinamidase-related amidase